MDQRLEAIIDKYENLIAEDPHNPEHHKELGNAFHRSGAYELALAEYRTALHIDPAYYPAQYNMGNTYFALERNEQAIISWQKALLLKPDLEHAIYNIAFLYYRMGLVEENREFRRRYLDDARIEFEKAIEMNPENPDSHLHLGLTFYELEAYERAVDCYENVLRIDGDDAYAHYNLGNAYYEQGLQEGEGSEFFKRAMKEYRAALKLNPSDGKSHNNIADCYLHLGELDRAQKEIKAVLKRFPDAPGALCTLGEIRARQGRHAEAIAEFQKIIALDPEEHDLLHRFASRKLVKEYAALIEVEPDAHHHDFELGRAHKDLGIAYEDRSHLLKARDAFRSALQKDNGWLDAHIELAESYMLLDNLDFAILEIETALYLDPESIAAHCILGQIYIQAGERDLARGEFSFIKKRAAIAG